MSDELSYQLIKLIEDSPEMSQRELARRLGISLGRTNYCLRALINKGWLKTQNFKNSSNKLAYRYVLTPQGVLQKAQLTRAFLQRKMVEFEQLKQQIDQLQQDVVKLDTDETGPK